MMSIVGPEVLKIGTLLFVSEFSQPCPSNYPYNLINLGISNAI
jgi:hypothetical protein